MRRILLPTLLLLLALPTAAPAVAAPTITEYATGMPASVTAGGASPAMDFGVWFTSPTNPGHVVRAAADGTISVLEGGDGGSLPKDKKPLGIAIGPDENQWIAASAGKLLRMTIDGDVSEFSVSGGKPTAVAAGSDGRVWFTKKNSAAIGRMDVDGANEVEFTTGLSPDAELDSIVLGPDGNLWFTEGGPGRIGRITPGGEITEFTTGITAGRQPTAIVAGSDGALWFTEIGAGGGIGRITPDGTITEFSTALTIGGTPAGITRGPDGAVWFTQTAGPGSIARITPDGRISQFSVGLTPNSSPAAIAPGFDAGVWFLETGNPPRVGRIGVPPVVGPATVTDVTHTSATVHASLQPINTATTIHVEVTAAGGAAFVSEAYAAGSGTTVRPVTVQVSGLTPGTAYSVRIVATNTGGSAEGDSAEFTSAERPAVSTPAPVDATPAPVDATPAPADPTPAPADAAPGAGGSETAITAVPLPALGKTVVLQTGRGAVRIKVPGQRGFSNLADVATLPVGTVIDTTNGVVRLETALADGTTQVGTFRGGTFRVNQSAKAGGMTEIKLAGGSFARCAQRATGSLAVASAKRSRRIRQLWGSDKGGRFRTHGQDSVATVRGTRWLTRDTCRGTLTRVTEGAVDVRPRGSRRSVRVRAGHSYLARARG